MFPKLTYHLAHSFMLRRHELEKLTTEDLHIDKASSRVTVFLKSSKGDQQARGVRRTLGCACASLTPALCPVEGAAKLKDSLLALGVKDPSNNKVWLTSAADGRRLVKNKVVKAWGEATGRRVQGHSLQASAFGKRVPRTLFFLYLGPRHAHFALWTK